MALGKAIGLHVTWALPEHRHLSRWRPTELAILRHGLLRDRRRLFDLDRPDHAVGRRWAAGVSERAEYSMLNGKSAFVIEPPVVEKWRKGYLQLMYVVVIVKWYNGCRVCFENGHIRIFHGF
jgi:hypothetical protein